MAFLYLKIMKFLPITRFFILFAVSKNKAIALENGNHMSSVDNFHRALEITYLNNCNILDGNARCCSSEAICDGNNAFTVDEGSCRGPDACKSVGNGGNAVIGKYSCIGAYACQAIGSHADSFVTTVGDGSCLGDQACYYVGRLTDASSSIGEGSCQGFKTCYSTTAGKHFVVGNGSCNCDNCCECLEAGDIVPHNSCNTLGENQCCQADGSKGTNMDLSQPLDPEVAPEVVYEAPDAYEVLFGGCTNDFASSEATVGTLTCTFTVSGGSGFTVSSDVYDDTSCDSAAPDGISQHSSSTTEDTHTSSIVIENSAAVAGDAVTFCLKTTVFDVNGNAMYYIGELLSMNFEYSGSFDGVSLTTTQFNGISATATDAGSNTFTIDVYRCDQNGDASPATSLSLQETLFICIDSKADGIVIEDITFLVATKDQTVKDLIANSVSDANTIVYGENTGKAVIATLLPLIFFESEGSVNLSGNAELVASSRRYLSNIMSKREVSSEFELTFDIETDYISSPGGEEIPSSGATTTVSVGVALVALDAAFLL